VDEDGKDVKRGEPGEALIRGPIVTMGYHNNDEANKNAYTPDGWLRTGDILREQDGEFYLVDRKKVHTQPSTAASDRTRANIAPASQELIKYKGLQIAPAELEGIIASHPAILDAAVIGVQQEDTEVPRAYVVLAPPAVGKLTEEDVARYVQSKVAGYKRLRGGVKFVDAVPRSPSGKILRKEVRELRKREEKESKL
jgi:acyl-CoA synthetase (AMP-forming)/AMP-acid ligase II